jgi:hypothetical protein
LALDEGCDVCQPTWAEKAENWRTAFGERGGIAVEDGSKRLRENTTKIIPFETAEPQANKVDTGPEG